MFYALAWSDFQKIFSSSRIGHIKKYFFKGRGFPRWLGQENEENVALTRNCCGWPSSLRQQFSLFNYFMKSKV